MSSARAGDTGGEWRSYNHGVGCCCRPGRDFEFKLLAFLPADLKRERHTLVRGMRAGVERVGHARHGIVDEDRLERFFTGATPENTETFEALLAACATFTVAIKEARD